ncbi:MAG: ComEC/Rec2 family competence protein [Spirochaetales bacterium]|nr:ComEC/Rec2 family competence protein [Spirochaetales bacterium]
MKWYSPETLCLGSAVFYTAFKPMELSLLSVLIPLVLLAGWVSLFGRRGRLLFLVLLVFLSASGAVYHWQSRVCIPFPPEQCCSVNGVLAEEPSWTSRGNLYLRINLVHAGQINGAAGEGAGTISVFLPEEKAPRSASWIRGDSIQVSGSMALLENRPVFFARTLNQYTMKTPGSFRRRLLGYVRQRAAGISDFSQTLLPALVLGLNHPLQERCTRLFRETGTAHIIALSGFHSGLVAALLYGFFRIIFGARGGLAAAGLGLLYYLYLAGPGPSLVRSVIMYEIVLLCKLGYRKPDLKKVLLASWLFSALFFPPSLQTLSARLSYLALWGLLFSTGHFEGLLHFIGIPFLRKGLSASLAAQVWTFPLVLTSFSVWYPAGIVASLVLTPLVALYMYSSLLYLLLPDIRFLTFLPVLLCRLLESLLIRGAEFFRMIPSLSAASAGPGLFLILLFPLLLGVVYRPGGNGGKREPEPELRLSYGD